MSDKVEYKADLSVGYVFIASLIASHNFFKDIVNPLVNDAGGFTPAFEEYEKSLLTNLTIINTTIYNQHLSFPF